MACKNIFFGMDAMELVVVFEIKIEEVTTIKQSENKTELTYHEVNGYLYPDHALSKQALYTIVKYGDLYLSFLKEHKKATYTTLLTTCKLNEYLHKIDLQAHEMLNKKC